MMEMPEDRQAVLRILQDAASRGARCPSNIDISYKANLSSRATATYHVKQLEADGFIRVKRGSNVRSVEIVETGCKTAEIQEREYIHRSQAKKARQMSQDDIARLVRHDDSCFKCGTARGCNCGVVL